MPSYSQPDYARALSDCLACQPAGPSTTATACSDTSYILQIDYILKGEPTKLICPLQSTGSYSTFQDLSRSFQNNLQSSCKRGFRSTLLELSSRSTQQRRRVAPPKVSRVEKARDSRNGLAFSGPVQVIYNKTAMHRPPSDTTRKKFLVKTSKGSLSVEIQ